MKKRYWSLLSIVSFQMAFAQENLVDTSVTILSPNGANSVKLLAPASYPSGSWTFTFPTDPGLNGYTLTTDGNGNTSWSSILTNPMSALGDLIYDDGSAPQRLGGNTTSTKKFLTQTGDGTLSAAPEWLTILGSDVPVVIPGTSAGVVSANGLPGRSSSSAIGAGYVGEVVVGTYSGGTKVATTANTLYDSAAITLSAGSWRIEAAVTMYNTTTAPNWAAVIRDSSNNILATETGGNGGTVSGSVATARPVAYVNISSSETFKFWFAANTVGVQTFSDGYSIAGTYNLASNRLTAQRIN